MPRPTLHGIKKEKKAKTPKPLETDNIIEKVRTGLTIKKAAEESNVEKLKSRKLWVTVGGASLITSLTIILLSIGISEETTVLIVSWIGKITLGYAGAQGAVDITKAIQAGKEQYKEENK